MIWTDEEALQHDVFTLAELLPDDGIMFCAWSDAVDTLVGTYREMNADARKQAVTYLTNLTDTLAL